MNLPTASNNAEARAKDAVAALLHDSAPRLEDLSHRIHGTPELAFQEHSAAAWVAEEAERAGLRVQSGVAGLPTALRATAGSGDLTIGICAEYDALPGIGHACGHNVIAAAAVGAAAALAAVADDLGITVVLLGTPAEENGGGKIIMLERGAFDGLQAAMMIHPAAHEAAQMRPLAVSHFDAFYHGKSSHASMHPEEGINASDAMVVAQVAISLARQQLRQGEQVHGIVTKGGDAGNIIPAETSGTFFARAETLEQLQAFLPRIHACFEAGATATGAALEIAERSSPYSELRADAALTDAYAANASALGRHPLARGQEQPGGSTDMGNVSLAIPSIHPMVSIDSLPAVNHQPEFAAAAASPAADKALVEGAIAMAWTAVDAALKPELRKRLTQSAYAAKGPPQG